MHTVATPILSYWWWYLHFLLLFVVVVVVVVIAAAAASGILNTNLPLPTCSFSLALFFSFVSSVPSVCYMTL
jgi:hypothetical protein